MRRIFRGCYLASLDFANEWCKREGKKQPIKLTKKEIEEASYYLELFRPKFELNQINSKQVTNLLEQKRPAFSEENKF